MQGTYAMICLMFLAALTFIILMLGLSYLTLFLCMENLWFIAIICFLLCTLLTCLSAHNASGYIILNWISRLIYHINLYTTRPRLTLKINTKMIRLIFAIMIATWYKEWSTRICLHSQQDILIFTFYRFWNSVDQGK